MLHGEADIVTDPSISKALYNSALSFDKEMKLYPGMWHGLTSGEPDENIEKVFEWLDSRSMETGSVSPMESYISMD